MESKNSLPITQQEAIENIVNFLKGAQKQHKKLKEIEISADAVTFKYGKIHYYVFVEDWDEVTFCINGFDYAGGPVLQNDSGKDIWQQFEEHGEWDNIEDYFEEVVVPEEYEYIPKIWEAFAKLERECEAEDLVTELAAEYFGLTQ